MTGADLATIRKAAGLSQAELAQRVGIGRHAVSYWECRPQVERRAWAVCCMAEVLTLPDMHACQRAAIERVAHREATLAAQDEAFAAMVMRLQARRDLVKATRRVRCGAKTRKGMPCQVKSEPGKRRCKFHGGRSTGAKTPEGKARIAEAQRRRWSVWRAERNQSASPSVTPEKETFPDASP